MALSRRGWELYEPADPVAGRVAALFVGLQRQDEVTVRFVVFLLVADQVGNERSRHVLVVAAEEGRRGAVAIDLVDIISPPGGMKTAVHMFSIATLWIPFTITAALSQVAHLRGRDIRRLRVIEFFQRLHPRQMRLLNTAPDGVPLPLFHLGRQQRLQIAEVCLLFPYSLLRQRAELRSYRR